MNTAPLILTHTDFDGWLAGAITRLELQQAGDTPEVRHYRYGDACPVEEARGRCVYVLDFGWPAEVMADLLAAAKTLIWVDHHPESVRSELQVYGERAAHHCAAWLTWKMFHPWGPVPAIVEAADDHDRWVHVLSETRALAAAVEAAAYREGALWGHWLGLLAGAPELLRATVEAGQAILAAQERRVAYAARQAVALQLDGHQVLAVNASSDFNEIADALASDGRVVWLWCVTTRQGRPQVPNSLRARKGGVDVGELARVRGGGGHPSAAGWTCNVIEAEILHKLAGVIP